MIERFSIVPSAIALAFVAAACASTPGTNEVEGGAEPATSSDQSETLPPPGFGTLRQDDFTLSFRSERVQIKLTPLAESVIRLAAPDTYQRLHAMVTSRQDRIERISRENGITGSPRLFLVSFFTFERQARFNPTDLNILSKGMLHRPLGILPLTPGWGQEQLMQEETQSALYIYGPTIDMDVELRVEYGNAGTRDWGRIIHLLESERSRVLSRAQS
jgi:hypothetical protein